MDSVSTSFDKDWMKYLCESRVPIKDIKGPDVFSLAFTPPVGKTYRFTQLSASSKEENQCLIALKLEPFMFSVIQGSFIIEARGGGDVLARGNTSINQSHGRYFPLPEERSTGPWVLPLKEKGRWVKAAAKNKASDERCPINPGLLVLGIPENYECRVGGSWKGPTPFLKVSSATETVYNIVGFADVGGVATAKIQTSTSMHPQPIKLSQMSKKNMREKLVKRGISKNLAEMMVSGFARQPEEPSKEPIDLEGVAYVDLCSGLNVRIELSAILKDGEQVFSHIIICQTFVT